MYLNESRYSDEGLTALPPASQNRSTSLRGWPALVQINYSFLDRLAILICCWIFLDTNWTIERSWSAPTTQWNRWWFIPSWWRDVCCLVHDLGRRRTSQLVNYLDSYSSRRLRRHHHLYHVSSWWWSWYSSTIYHDWWWIQLQPWRLVTDPSFVWLVCVIMIIIYW